MSTIRLAVSVGDLNGISLECLLRALPHVSPDVEITLCSNEVSLRSAIAAHGLTADVRAGALVAGGRTVSIRPIEAVVDVEPGALDAHSGLHAVQSLDAAVDLVQRGQAHGVVTLPLSKDVCGRAGFGFPGQTEYLADKAQGQAVMVLCSGTVRVALATIHVPLRRVADTLTSDRIEDTVRVLDRHLRADRGVGTPRVAVLALNPHAGEHGRIGSEEDVLIRPSIERLCLEGYNVDGPHAADGFFAFGDYRNYDGIVAMYHDQGLIPLKLLANGGGVNCTVGLSLVRTSPDHGTAFGIAGKGLADERSTVEAIALAADIIRTRVNFR